MNDVEAIYEKLNELVTREIDSSKSLIISSPDNGLICSKQIFRDDIQNRIESALDADGVLCRRSICDDVYIIYSIDEEKLIRYDMSGSKERAYYNDVLDSVKKYVDSLYYGVYDTLICNIKNGYVTSIAVDITGFAALTLLEAKLREEGFAFTTIKKNNEMDDRDYYQVIVEVPYLAADDEMKLNLK